ncbi:MAG: chemotaxis protein CheW [Acidobacteriota bacterium]
MPGKINKKRTESFNWEQLREKMAKLSNALNAKLDEAALAATLAERADQLANSVDIVQYEQTADVLIFELAQEQYAIDTSYVSEVVPLKLLTHVPGAPDFILGVVSRRGEIVSVIDLSRFMHIVNESSCQHLIFVESQATQVGFAVHNLKEITRLARDTVQALPSQLSGEQAQYLSGVTLTGVALLNVPELLANERLNIDQQ